MKTNMSTADKGIRLIIAAIIAGLFFTNKVSGTTALLLGIVAAIFIATSLFGFCPLYRLFGFSTKEK